MVQTKNSRGRPPKTTGRPLGPPLSDFRILDERIAKGTEKKTNAGKQ
jgi:hypothetical protein